MSTLTQADLIQGIIDGTATGKAEAWLRWSKAKGWRILRTPQPGITEEDPIPEDIVSSDTANEGPDHYDDTLDADAPDTDFTYYRCIIFRGVPGMESCAEM